VTRLVVLDFDGTVAETRQAVSATLNASLAAHGMPRVHPPAIWGLMGLPLDTLVARCLPPTEPKDAVPSIVAGYRARFGELGAPLVGLLPGVDALLAAAAARSVPVAIATSRESSSLDGLLRRLGLTGRFQAIATCDRVARGKPAPDLVDAVLAELGVDAADAVVVGDTTWDVEMARAAGCVAVGVTTGDHAAERLVAAGAAVVVDGLEGVVGWLGW
jgi:phosphoglycolate phosphatase